MCQTRSLSGRNLLSISWNESQSSCLFRSKTSWLADEIRAGKKECDWRQQNFCLCVGNPVRIINIKSLAVEGM
jgi:hypothetical protein